jgi:hypothetical protein
MLAAKFHKPQSARFKFECEPFNFLPTSAPSHLDFLFSVHMSRPLKTWRTEKGKYSPIRLGNPFSQLEDVAINEKVDLLHLRCRQMTNRMTLGLGKNSGFDFAGHAAIQNQTTADRNYPIG